MAIDHEEEMGSTSRLREAVRRSAFNERERSIVEAGARLAILLASDQTSPVTLFDERITQRADELENDSAIDPAEVLDEAERLLLPGAIDVVRSILRASSVYIPTNRDNYGF